MREGKIVLFCRIKHMLIHVAYISTNLRHFWYLQAMHVVDPLGLGTGQFSPHNGIAFLNEVLLKKILQG